MSRVLVVTYDTVGRRMAGGAIRTFELSRSLAREHQVMLACRRPADREGDGFEVVHLPDAAQLAGLVPFGVPDEPPVPAGPVLRGVRPGSAPDDLFLLWAGGLYEWLAPFPLTAAVPLPGAPDVKLLFMGTAHPAPAAETADTITR